MCERIHGAPSSPRGLAPIVRLLLSFIVVASALWFDSRTAAARNCPAAATHHLQLRSLDELEEGSQGITRSATSLFTASRYYLMEGSPVVGEAEDDLGVPEITLWVSSTDGFWFGEDTHGLVFSARAPSDHGRAYD